MRVTLEIMLDLDFSEIYIENKKPFANETLGWASFLILCVLYVITVILIKDRVFDPHKTIR